MLEETETIDTWELLDVANEQWVCITVPMPADVWAFDVERFGEACEDAS
jgi:hypothetical protein